MATCNNHALSKILCHQHKTTQDTWGRKKKKCVEKEKARQIIKTIQECGRCHSEAEVTLRQKQIQSN